VPYSDIFQAAGGGLIGLLVVAIVALFSLLLWAMRARCADKDVVIEALRAELKEARADNRNLTIALDRLSDLVQSWTPNEQRWRTGR
jgi:hypothetical protein